MRYRSLSIANFIEEFASKNIDKKVYEDITSIRLGDLTSTIRQYSDQKYQRKFGAWSKEQKCSFISSLYSGIAYNPIVLSKITKTEREKNNLPKHIEFACLDGQHRSGVICEFVNNEFSFSGKLKIEGKIKEKTNCFFKDFTSREQKIFLNRTYIFVLFVVEGQNLRKVFLNINDGEPLNRQEKRNAIDCPIAGWTREQSKKYSSFFTKVSKVSRFIDRMSDRKLMSQIALVLSSLEEADNDNPSVASVANEDDGLDEFYNKGVVKGYVYNQSILDYISNNLLSGLEGVSPSDVYDKKRKVLLMPDIWAYIILHYYTFYKHSQDESEIDAGAMYEFCINVVKDLSSVSESLKYKNMQSIEFAKNDEERKKAEQNHKTTDYFHLEKSRLHTGYSMRFFYKKLIEHFSKNPELICERILDTKQDKKVA